MPKPSVTPPGPPANVNADQAKAPGAVAGPNVSPTSETTPEATSPRIGSPKKSRESSWAEESADAAMDTTESTKAAAKHSKSAAKDAKRKLREKITITLWPHPEIVQAFYKKVGAEPNLHRLVSDMKFKDLWHTFERMDPTDSKAPKVITDMRRRAEDLSRPKKKDQTATATSSSTRGREETPASSSASTKRDRSTTSSDGSNTAPPFKIPKKGTNTAEAVCEVVEKFSTTELTDEEIKSAADEAEGGSYAAAAAGKKTEKKTYPFILFVNGSEDERQPIERKTWSLLEEKLAVKIAELQMEDKPFPFCDWMGFKSGTGIMACVDEESRSLAKDLVAETNVAGLTFRGWGKGEAGKYQSLSFKVPSELKSLPANKITMALVRGNKLPDSGFKIGKVASSKDNTTRRIFLLGEADFVEALKGTPRLQIGGKAVTVTYHDA